MRIGTSVSVKHQAGSVQHYYHFLLGFLVPLTALCARYGDELSYPLYVRECGPLTVHLGALRQIVPLPPDRLPPPALSVAGCDAPRHYDRARFDECAAYVRTLAAPAAPAMPKVLLVERVAGHSFYATADSEIPTSGAERCAIRNHVALAAGLARRLPSFANVVLDTMDLTGQRALFNAADVVIAQHGAALANIIFMRPGARVIEIGPDRGQPMAMFRQLADVMAVEHAFVPKRHAYPDVRVDEIMSLIDR